MRYVFARNAFVVTKQSSVSFNFSLERGNFFTVFIEIKGMKLNAYLKKIILALNN